MGMKFHKFYVAVINPLGIILMAIIAILLLIVSLNAVTIAEEADIPYFSGFEAGVLLWVLFGFVAATFLFMLITEFLLVARKKSGIVLLSFSLILGIVSHIVSYVGYDSQTPWYSMVISLVVSALILVYYWKRYKEFAPVSTV